MMENLRDAGSAARPAIVVRSSTKLASMECLCVIVSNKDSKLNLLLEQDKSRLESKYRDN